MDSDQSDADLLRTELGQILTEALGGNSGPDIGVELAARVWRALERGGVAADVARAWFIDANPLLGEDTPVAAIREGRTEAVVAAVRALTHTDGDPDQVHRERVLADDEVRWRASVLPCEFDPFLTEHLPARYENIRSM